MPNKEIRIEIKENIYFLSVYIDGKINEQYRPETKEVVNVWVNSILNGFEPPRNLIHLNKISNQEQTKKIESIVDLLKGLSLKEAKNILALSIRKCEEKAKL